MIISFTSLEYFVKFAIRQRGDEMTHIICADLAHPAVDYLLRDWNNNSVELTEFINLLNTKARLQSFGKSEIDSTEDVDACEAIVYLMQASLIEDEVREHFIREENEESSWADLEEDELESWETILQAIIFASKEVVEKILKGISPELKHGAMGVLMTEIQTLNFTLHLQ